jgi:hypothetical protein
VRWLKTPFTFAFIRALLIRQSMGYVLTRETVMAGVSHRTFTLHRLRGDLLNATGEWVAAEENYHLALAVAERQSTKTFELRAATRLACLWRDQGKRSEARDLLAPIYGWFTEGFDTPVLQDAKALLDQLAEGFALDIPYARG